MATPRVISSRIGAVVVTYQPDSDVFENLKLIAVQVDLLIIVDNGSSAVFRSLLQPFLNTQVVLIRHPENLGIATGFNAGIRKLIEGGCQYVFTFDQDSQIPINFIQNMVQSFYKAEQRFDKIGVLMPMWHDSTHVNAPVFSKEIREVRQGISSGSIYSVNVFNEIGFFADHYFIDGVDIEFCLRCQTQNWRVLQDTSIMIEHSLGQEEIVNLFGLQFPIVVHSAFRKYFIARNRVLNYRKYALRNVKWFFEDFWIFIRELFHIFAYEKEKLNKLRHTLIGIQDGITNRTGEINQKLK
jgi:rhamnosyltransferase